MQTGEGGGGSEVHTFSGDLISWACQGRASGDDSQRPETGCVSGGVRFCSVGEGLDMALNKPRPQVCDDDHLVHSELA